MDTAELASALPLARPLSRWSRDVAVGMSEAELLVYRSHLLGADLSVTNFGGGNTSVKLEERDPISQTLERVLWVKGSGGDLGSITAEGFSRLYLSKLEALESHFRGPSDEEGLAELYAYAAFAPGIRAPSIDTPLHALLPFRHIDHVHPDPIIALATTSGGRSAIRAIFGDDVGWTPWLRPGFELALRLRALVQAHPALRGVVLAGHGLISWGETSEACYANTIDLIAKASDFLNARLAAGPHPFGRQRSTSRSAADRAEAAAKLAPKLRSLAGDGPRKIVHFDDSPEVLEFLCGHDAKRLAQVGTSCPDHFLRTKIQPLYLPASEEWASESLAEAFENYKHAYQAYYDRCKHPTSPPMRDPNPVIVLCPGVGLFALAKDKPSARIAAEFYSAAINVMRGASAVGEYAGLSEEEAFNIEYWSLEEAKLRRQPAPSPMEGRIALVTGGGGGIGRATARRLLTDGACVVLADRDADALTEASEYLTGEFGKDRVRASVIDVTDELAVGEAFRCARREFGGLDILVASAGIASAAPIEQTTLETWRRNHSVLVDGYFLVAREAFPLLKDFGGSIVFVGSKNALAATADAAAYASAKAAELHLARCLALEGAPHGIRVNVVNPDAVIRGSRIWDSDWRRERASTHGIDPGEALEAHYRERSLLKREVLSEDVAEAIAFLVSERAAKSTGNVLNVDAGNAQAFPR